MLDMLLVLMSSLLRILRIHIWISKTQVTANSLPIVQQKSEPVHSIGLSTLEIYHNFLLSQKIPNFVYVNPQCV